MLQAERLRYISETINKDKIVSICELCSALNSSKATIRRDLKILEETNKLVRTHGGAILAGEGTSNEPRFRVKKDLNKEEKMRIAEAASRMIKAGETVILDSGTTVLWMAKYLNSIKNIMVATNDLLIANELATNDDINLNVIGGGLRKNFYTLMGYFAETMLKEIHADKLFLGVDAVNLNTGFMIYNAEEIAIKKLMIESAKEVIVLCDHSKFKSIAFVNICPINRVHRVITDNGIDPDIVNSIKDLGVEVEIV